MSENTSVVIVDDHTLFRTGLFELLTRRGLSVVGMTGQATEAVDLVGREEPDIVLLDLRMPELGGLTVLERIIEANAKQCVVILTTSVDDHDLLEALRIGASGYLLKDMEPDGLVDCIKRAVAGDTVVAPDLTGVLARAAVSREPEVESPPVPVSNLTAREMEILGHVAKGQSNKEIARHLGITDGTVKLHVRAILKKLNVTSRVQAAVLAVSEGICETDKKEDS